MLPQRPGCLKEQSNLLVSASSLLRRCPFAVRSGPHIQLVVTRVKTNRRIDCYLSVSTAVSARWANPTLQSLYFDGNNILNTQFPMYPPIRLQTRHRFADCPMPANQGFNRLQRRPRSPAENQKNQQSATESGNKPCISVCCTWIL
jgi:hypothetical protein